ncbi:hypothetical protein ACHAXR_003116, partial [Thalassiosira sp. AJA248-18]
PISDRVQNRVHAKFTSSLNYHIAAQPPSASTLPLATTNSNRSINKFNDHNASCHQISQIRCYGSQAKVQLEKQTFPGMQPIQPYIRTCLNSDGANNNAAGINMEFAISFLGTGGGAPTMNRNASCTALRLGGQTYLFDVSEGTARQLEFSRIVPSSISKIFISHLHGDHLFGLVPAILCLGTAHKQIMSDPQRKKKHSMDHGGDKPRLEIYGPPGLYNYINMTLKLSCAKVNYLDVRVIELVGGREERGPMVRREHRTRGRRNIFTSHYPEFETPNIKRQYLTQNEDKVWIIDAPEPITDDSVEKGVGIGRQDGFHRLPNDVNLGVGRRLHIKAAELDHLGGVQTFGYTVEEQPPPGTIDVEKAKQMGIQPSKKYGLLKCGLSVTTDDGTGEVHPHEVIVKSFRPRKFAFLADHRLVPTEMAQLCKGADLLVHEATLSKKDGLDKIKMRGHNTAYNAGLFGRSMGCKVVALNHFGSTSCGREYVGGMLFEAREGNQSASQIIASHDFMEVWIPRGGFDFNGTRMSPRD